MNDSDTIYAIVVLVVIIVALIKAEQPIKDINRIFTRPLYPTARKSYKIRSRRNSK